MSWIPPPASVPAGGRKSGHGVGGWRGAGTFCPRVVLTLLGEGGGVRGGRATTGLGNGRSITFEGTQCLSKVKSDFAFLS
jgi:hypothetical protein